MLDTTSWAWPNALPRFDCANQGISRARNQPRADSALPLLNERDHGNNILAVDVVVPCPQRFRP
jgi:hypothetical protein